MPNHPMLFTLTCITFVSAQYNASNFVTDMLGILGEEIYDDPKIDTRLSEFDHPYKKGKRIKFFRAYFEGYDIVRREGRCSINDGAEIIDCLVRFPSTKVIAFGNWEGEPRPLIQFTAFLEDVLFVLELKGKRSMSLSKFYAATDPFVEFNYKRNPFKGNWEKDLHPKFSDWIQMNFMKLVDWHVKPKLKTLVPKFSTPSA